MITAITMPKWGLTMTEGKVVHWLKQPGASFAAGDELLEIETSKITNVVEAEGTGSLARIVAPEGSTLPIGALLAVIAPPETQAAEIDAFVSKFVVVAPADAGSEDVAPPAPRELEGLGRTLRCLELGNGGVPALLLHGFGGDLNTWMFNQPALCGDRRTLALELPGQGFRARTWAAAILRSSPRLSKRHWRRSRSNARTSSGIPWAEHWRSPSPSGGRSESPL